MLRIKNDRRVRRCGTLAIASLFMGLTACGGGSSSQDTNATQTMPGKVMLTGVVSKGLMGGARVSAHPVKDGVVDMTTELASGLTLVNGRYSLPAFEPVAGRPVVVVVKMLTDTVHTDELTRSSLPLPLTFSMRSAVVPQAIQDDKTVDLAVNITPFSEMVVRAAESSTTLDATSVAQGKSAITQMLGFDPIGTDVNGVSASNSIQVNAQGLMLAAVSQLATGPDSATLGCKNDNAGEAIACTVNKLAQAASLTTVKLVVGDTDVGASLSRSIETVSGNVTVVPKDVDVSATVDVITDHLACVNGSLTNPCEVPKVDLQVTGVAAAKAMFTALRTSISGWFSRGGLAGDGRLNRDAQAFESALNSARTPLDQVTQDLAALQLGVELYKDFKSGRTAINARNGGVGDADGFDKTTWLASGASWSNDRAWRTAAYGCTLYTDATLLNKATSASDVGAIGCRSSSRIEIDRRITATTGNAGMLTMTDWRHGFTIVPKTDASVPAGKLAFNYSTSVSKRVASKSCTVSVLFGGEKGCGELLEDDTQRVNLPVLVDNARTVFKGSIFTSPIDLADVAVEVTGQFAALLDTNTGGLLSDHQVVTLSAQDDGTVASVATLTGKIEVFDTSTASVASSTLELAPDSQVTFMAAREDGSRPEAGESTAFRTVKATRIGLTWRSSGAALSGVLHARDIEWDRSGVERQPAALTFTGSLDIVSAGATHRWITAELDMTHTGYADHDIGQVVGPGNPAYTVGGTFSGTITPTDGKPPFFLRLSSSKASNEPSPKTVTGTLRMGTGTAPKVNIELSGSTDAAGQQTWSLHETTQDVTLTLRPPERTTQIRHGSAQVLVGNIDHDRRRVNYVDLTFESMDLGL